jgi:hypothetical protein
MGDRDRENRAQIFWLINEPSTQLVSKAARSVNVPQHISAITEMDSCQGSKKESSIRGEWN